MAILLISSGALMEIKEAGDGCDALMCTSYMGNTRIANVFINQGKEI